MLYPREWPVPLDSQNPRAQGMWRRGGGVEIHKRLLEAPESEWVMLRTRHTTSRAGVLYKYRAGCSVTADIQEMKMSMSLNHDAFN